MNTMASGGPRGACSAPRPHAAFEPSLSGPRGVGRASGLHVALFEPQLPRCNATHSPTASPTTSLSCSSVAAAASSPSRQGAREGGDPFATPPRSALRSAGRQEAAHDSSQIGGDEEVDEDSTPVVVVPRLQ